MHGAPCLHVQQFLLPWPQTVPASAITQYAKPLPKASVDKGKVWTVFAGGAAVLFMGTVLAENNAAWFPAIARANKAMQAGESEELPSAPPPQVCTPHYPAPPRATVHLAVQLSLFNSWRAHAK